VPPGATSKAVNEAIEEARREILAAVEEARQEAVDAAEAAKRDAEEASADAAQAESVPVRRVHKVSLGDFLPNLAMLWIVASIMIKITYKGRIQAEVKAAQATETAEAESLKRQVAEARMAALQAQVEPHFLFNTLAAIDHLIETDAPRASVMQKNLIAYLRATLQQMREGATTLGREVDLITAYLEILKVRMEERLEVRIDVPAGLRSAAFPPMMLQSLVENAIKHGLEPCCDAATLSVSAEVSDGSLRVSVADTGAGYDPQKSDTRGTGLGLANIRERLAMMHGTRARLDIAAQQPRGTLATITLPYAVRNAAATVPA
jgi:LytS/YehU family sensor histidine kinase